MKCPNPNCQSIRLDVLETRQVKKENAIRRRRQCLDCKHRFTTKERINREEEI